MSYSRIPCGMPNSLTPLAGPVYSDRFGVNQTMVQGSAALRDLVESLGGLWPDSDGLLGQSGQTEPTGGGRLRGRFRFRGNGGVSSLPPACGAVVLSAAPGSWRPLAPVLTQPVARVVPPRVARRIENNPVPVQVVAAPPAAGPTICDSITPENVCEAAVRGCFAAGQVDPLQLAACAASGWQGNRNEFPGVVARGGANGGSHIGLINTHPRMPNGQPGPGITAVNDSSHLEVNRMAADVGMGQYSPFEAGGTGAIVLGLALIGGAILVSARRGTR